MLHDRSPPAGEQPLVAAQQRIKAIREVIPESDLETLNDMIGVPMYFNLAFVPTDNVSSMDADILIGLKEHHRPTEEYIRELRRELPRSFPGSTFYFQPADIISQVLNFGLSAPLDIQVEYPNLAKGYAVARELRLQAFAAGQHDGRGPAVQPFGQPRGGVQEIVRNGVHADRPRR